MISIPTAKPFAIRSPMAEYAQFTTTRASGVWGGTNTAFVTWKGSQNLTVEWSGTGWSGGNATEVYSGLGTLSYNYAYISRAVSGAGSKTIRFYPTDTSGRRIGSLFEIQLSFVSTTQTTTPITSVDVKNAIGLEVLMFNALNAAALTSVDVSGMKKLVTLHIYNGASLTSVNVTDCTSLTSLALDGQSNLSSITGLSSLKNNLQSLQISNNNAMTSLDVSNFSSLYNLNLLSAASLTTLRAQNVMLYTQSYSGSGSYISALAGGANLQFTTSMTVAAMDQFYTDLATETTGFPAIIAVYNSGGGPGSNTPIATAKNYTVLGVLPP